MEKYVLVTGANGGMGKSVCEALLKNGYKVFALDLNPTDTNDKNIVSVKADISDKQSLLAAKEYILTVCKKIFAIINLAGFFAMDSIVCGDEIKLKKSFDVNFWGVFNTNRVFFDMLEPNGRIVVMSSEVARYSPHPFDGFYALPKISLDKYCDVLRRECRFLGIKVIKIQAGSFNTGMSQKALAEFEDLKATATEFSAVLNVFGKFVGKEIGRGANTEIIAKTVLKILQKKSPKICYRVKNSAKLGLINAFSQKTQDDIYPFAVKCFSPKKQKHGDRKK